MIVRDDRPPLRTLWVVVFGLALGAVLHWWLPAADLPAGDRPATTPGTVSYADRCDQEVCP